MGFSPIKGLKPELFNFFSINSETHGNSGTPGNSGTRDNSEAIKK